MYCEIMPPDLIGRNGGSTAISGGQGPGLGMLEPSSHFHRGFNLCSDGYYCDVGYNFPDGISYQYLNGFSDSNLYFSQQNFIPSSNIVSGGNIMDLIDRFKKLRVSSSDMKNIPHNAHKCHFCHQEGHLKKDCSKAVPKGKFLTPYQGKKMCFGEYKCSNCKRKWMSANSWANMGQECRKCRINVYPHKQRPLENPDGLDVSDQSKVHPQELCQKCKMLGVYCRTSFLKIF